jgi:hypothetical protein
MALGKVPARSSQWFWIPLRVLLVTFLLTLLSFAVSLFLGIMGTVVAAWLRGVRPNMRMAYLHFAAPVAAVVATVAIVWITAIEVRRYRQAKALAGIERAG